MTQQSATQSQRVLVKPKLSDAATLYFAKEAEGLATALVPLRGQHHTLDHFIDVLVQRVRDPLDRVTNFCFHDLPRLEQDIARSEAFLAGVDRAEIERTAQERGPSDKRQVHEVPALLAEVERALANAHALLERGLTTRGVIDRFYGQILREVDLYEAGEPGVRSRVKFGFYLRQEHHRNLIIKAVLPKVGIDEGMLTQILCADLTWLVSQFTHEQGFKSRLARFVASVDEGQLTRELKGTTFEVEFPAPLGKDAVSPHALLTSLFPNQVQAPTLARLNELLEHYYSQRASKIIKVA